MFLQNPKPEVLSFEGLGVVTSADADSFVASLQREVFGVWGQARASVTTTDIPKTSKTQKHRKLPKLKTQNPKP